MTPRNRTSGTHEMTRGARAGFTLIELLVVIFILGILVTLVVGVGQYVYTEAARKQTITTQTLLKTAIDAFHDTFEQYPADREDPNTYIATDSGEILMRYLTGRLESGRDDDAYRYLMGEAPTGGADFDKLNQRIRAVTQETILKISPGAYSGADDEAIRDADGDDMQYAKEGGLAGRPVIISRGPDEEFGNEDDIRSDEH